MWISLGYRRGQFWRPWAVKRQLCLMIAVFFTDPLKDDNKMRAIRNQEAVKYYVQVWVVVQ